MEGAEASGPECPPILFHPQESPQTRDTIMTISLKANMKSLEIILVWLPLKSRPQDRNPRKHCEEMREEVGREGRQAHQGCFEAPVTPLLKGIRASVPSIPSEILSEAV